jgi:cysteine desulfurase/selenocysteine lyase
MCGPTGIGGLWARRELLEGMSPFHGGGEMIRVVERESSTWAEVPHKFEAGTPNIAGAIGLAAAVDYLDGFSSEAILQHERALLGYALERLREVPGLIVFGAPTLEERSGVIAFSLGDAHPHDISTILDMEGIAIRAGHHCAQLVMRHYDVAATARASFYLYNTIEEVERLAEAVGLAREMLLA